MAQDYCYLHALLFKRERLDGFSSLLSKLLSRLRRLLLEGAVEADMAMPLLTSALCAHHSACAAIARAGEPASETAGEADGVVVVRCASEMLASLFAALVPMLTLQVCSHQGRGGGTACEAIARCLDGLVPALMYIAQEAISIVQAIPPPCHHSLAQAMIALGNTILPLTREQPSTRRSLPRLAHPTQPSMSAFALSSAPPAAVASSDESTPGARSVSRAMMAVEALHHIAGASQAEGMLIAWGPSDLKFFRPSPPAEEAGGKVFGAPLSTPLGESDFSLQHLPAFYASVGTGLALEALEEGEGEEPSAEELLSQLAALNATAQQVARGCESALHQPQTIWGVPGLSHSWEAK
ncbi:MAG: hypothetical protein SGPRY_003777 [Prymnesium sp.]